jgi:hypothetical protein
VRDVAQRRGLRDRCHAEEPGTAIAALPALPSAVAPLNRSVGRNTSRCVADDLARRITATRSGPPSPCSRVARSTTSETDADSAAVAVVVL